MSTLTTVIRSTLFILIVSFCYQNLRSHPKLNDASKLKEKYGDWSVVIGASEGLGAEWANLFCENGLNVITVARRQNELEAKAQELRDRHGCLVKTLLLDLSDGENVSKILESTFNDYNVGLMVYNAAAFKKGSFLSDNLNDHLLAVEVNVASLTRAVYAFGNAAKANDRKSSGIIIMSSTLGDKGAATVSSYAASKAYDTVLAQSLANEMQEAGIDVLACVAGPIETPNFRRANGENTQDIDFMLMQPQDVANECLNALGHERYAIAPGMIMKISRFFTRVISTRSMVDGMSANMKSME